MLPTLRDLCDELGDDLAAVWPDTPPAAQVSAVHVSELVDPTRYLEGGELLLTTGLEFGRPQQSVQQSARWYRAYVGRLTAIGVTALGVGLGAVHDTVPPALLRAAQRAGLPLLSVPAPTPFLTVSRTYWAMLAESDQRELVATIGAHRALVAAALQEHPLPAVLRRLAVAVGGWTAHLSVDGEVLDVWPPEQQDRARGLQEAIDRMGVARLPSVATLPLGAEDVVIQPLGGADPLLGHVAVACRRPIPVSAQQVTMTAVALLSLDAAHGRRVRAAERVAPSAALAALAAGQTGAFERVAAVAGARVPDGLLRPAVLRAAAADDVLDALDRLPESRSRLVLAGALRSYVVALLPGGLRDAGSWLTGLRRWLPDVVAVVGTATALDDLPAELARMESLLDRLGPGEVTDLAAPAGPLVEVLGASSAAWAHAVLQPLQVGAQVELLATVEAYLRHRGDAEAASRALGVHRHTVRNRLARAEALLGVSVDDADTAAELWVALRVVGRA